VGEPEGFRDFAAARSAALLRTGWLLTGDWQLAQDLVQEALARTWPRWERLVRRDAPEVYVRKAMINIYLSWRRRRSWSAEVATASVPESTAPQDTYAAVELRPAVRAALSVLPARQRAVVVLRFFEDLTEPQTAEVLGCALGTVKSQTAKALAKLRADPTLAGLITEEATR
jgi:RNA polymerase sigma-70 factor (sigma-E family)